MSLSQWAPGWPYVTPFPCPRCSALSQVPFQHCFHFHYSIIVNISIVTLRRFNVVKKLIICKQNHHHPQFTCLRDIWLHHDPGSRPVHCGPIGQDQQHCFNSIIFVFLSILFKIIQHAKQNLPHSCVHLMTLRCQYFWTFWLCRMRTESSPLFTFSLPSGIRLSLSKSSRKSLQNYS